MLFLVSSIKRLSHGVKLHLKPKKIVVTANHRIIKTNVLFVLTIWKLDKWSKHCHALISFILSVSIFG